MTLAQIRSQGPRLGQVRRNAAQHLAQAGSATAALDARLLLQSILGLDGAMLLARDSDAIDPDDLVEFEALVVRRAAGEPVAHLLGAREFWGLEYRVTPDVLIPRADTETILEAALAHGPGRGEAGCVVDLGTGTGCLLIGFLAERPLVRGIGVDRSPDALMLARENARAHGVADRALFVQGDWTAPVGGHVDLVLSNPPYIPSADIMTLSPEVRTFEPHLALDGGADGLACLTRILDGLLTVLRPHGCAILEFGFDQRAAVSGLIAARSGLSAEVFLKDLSGHDRGVVVRAVG